MQTFCLRFMVALIIQFTGDPDPVGADEFYLAVPGLHAADSTTQVLSVTTDDVGSPKMTAKGAGPWRVTQSALGKRWHLGTDQIFYCGPQPNPAFVNPVTAAAQ